MQQVAQLKLPRKSEQVTKISGPSLVYGFVFNKKRYFIVGDKHTPIADKGCPIKNCDRITRTVDGVSIIGKDCTTIAALLHIWFLYNNDRKITTDFYIEVPYTKAENRADIKDVMAEIERRRTSSAVPSTFSKDPVAAASWIEVTSYLMNKCLTPSKTKECPYHDYVRSHYVDIRSISSASTARGYIVPDLLSIGDVNTAVTKYLTTFVSLEGLEDLSTSLLVYYSYLVYDLDDIVSFVIGNTTYEEFQQKWSKISVIPLLQRIHNDRLKEIAHVLTEYNGKQIHRIAKGYKKLERKDPKMASMILDYIMALVSHYQTNAIAAYTEIASRDVNEGHDLYASLVINCKDVVASMLETLTPISSVLMDMYVLTRVFYNDTSDDVIIYAGYRHSEHYVSFFTNILYVRAQIGSRSADKCINIGDLESFVNLSEQRDYVALNNLQKQ